MPYYEYQCPACGNIKEIQQKITDDPYEGLVCNICGGNLKKIISLSNFALKGGGWEKDGYSGGTRNERETGQ